MMIFYVVKYPDKRVVLRPTPATNNEESLFEIKAPTWKEARAKLVTDGFELFTHTKGYGYYDL